MTDPEKTPRWLARLDDLVVIVGVAFLLIALALRLSNPTPPAVASEPEPPAAAAGH